MDSSTNRRRRVNDHMYTFAGDSSELDEQKFNRMLQYLSMKRMSEPTRLGSCSLLSSTCGLAGSILYAAVFDGVFLGARMTAVEIGENGDIWTGVLIDPQQVCEKATIQLAGEVAQALIFDPYASLFHDGDEPGRESMAFILGQMNQRGVELDADLFKVVDDMHLRLRHILLEHFDLFARVMEDLRINKAITAGNVKRYLLGQELHDPADSE